MKDRELILEGPEGLFVEFKQKVNSSLSREVSAFANTSGGTIVIGLNDNGAIIGLNDLNENQSKIMSHARNCDPPVHIDAIAYRTRTGQDVIYVEIPDNSDRPHSCSEGFFLRSCSSTQKMIRDEIIRFLHSFIFDRIIPQDTPQVTPQDKMLFILYDKELSRDEIMEVIDLKDRKHFREIYLNPTIRSGFIEMTIPDKPNSPNQNYRLTSKGRSYLSKIEVI
ncbi:MAG: ATP-binding protein [Candidatus Thermoplasmatota archaeon]|nr:ATP-binding protein [Candidatus Thermoplasmatota archaeon]